MSEYGDEAKAAKKHLLDAQQQTADTYLSIIEKRFTKLPDTTSRNKVLNNLEGIIEDMRPVDPSAFEYEPNTFDRRYAKEVLRKYDLDSQTVANDLNITSSTLSMHYKQLENQKIDGPAKRRVLRYFKKLGYDPFDV